VDHPSLRLSNHDISDNGVSQPPTQTEVSPPAVNAATITVMATKKSGCGAESLRWTKYAKLLPRSFLNS
jgi:hypothetical protein